MLQPSRSSTRFSLRRRRALTGFVEESELHADARLEQAVLVAQQRAQEEHRDPDRVDQHLQFIWDGQIQLVSGRVRKSPESRWTHHQDVIGEEVRPLRVRALDREIGNLENSKGEINQLGLITRRIEDFAPSIVPRRLGGRRTWRGWSGSRSGTCKHTTQHKQLGTQHKRQD